MSNDGDEGVPLPGGNINAAVVRIGNTVRRARSRHSQANAFLLRHLETAGFPNAPRFLGFDALGRETLSFLEGSPEPPADLWQNDQSIEAAAKMLRRYHDCTRSIAGVDDVPWSYAHPDPARHEVICHNDFAPYNMIFRKGLPIGIVDFDLAGPGPALRDIAYLAFWFAPLSLGPRKLGERGRAEMAGGCPRLRKLCAAYGNLDPVDVLEAVAEQLHFMANPENALAMIGESATERLSTGGHFKNWAGEARAFDAGHAAFRRVLN